jgi:hypothetical protein
MMRLSLAVATAMLAASIMSAQADEWCGFLDKDGSQVRCGFSSLDECKKTMDAQNAKDAVCMPDPSFARNESAVRLAAIRF